MLLCAGTIALVTQKFSLNKTNLAFSAVLLPVTLLNGLFFVFGATWWISVIFVLVACVCAFVIFLYYAAPRWLKIMSSVLSVFVFLILLLTIAMSALFHAFGDFGSNTVVKALLSPDGAHVARVVDSDQGALGGETFVEVESTAGAVPVFLGEFKPVPVRIYTGDWGEYMDMEIFWKGNDAVIINGKEYRIFKYW